MLALLQRLQAGGLQKPAAPHNRLDELRPCGRRVREGDRLAEHCAHLRTDRLAHLRTDRLDLLQLHTWTRTWNPHPTPCKVRRELRHEGLIGLIGLSPAEHDQNSLIDLRRGGRIDAVPVIYHRFDQKPAAERLDVAYECGAAIIARVARDPGSLTGKFTAATRSRPPISAPPSQRRTPDALRHPHPPTARDPLPPGCQTAPGP